MSLKLNDDDDDDDNVTISESSYFWTAGQRIDPTTGSSFVWRVTSTHTYSDTLSLMTFTNWNHEQPDYARNIEACVHLIGYRSYRWNDACCARKYSSVCELDI